MTNAVRRLIFDAGARLRHLSRSQAHLVRRVDGFRASRRGVPNALTMKQCMYSIAAVALAALLAACGGSTNGSNAPASTGGVGSSKSYAELHWGELPFPGPIDVTDNLYGEALTAESLVVQNLVEFEPSGKLKLGLASSIEHPNATTYIYNVRSGIKFSDGQPLTIADVVYSLTRDMQGKESSVKTYWEDVASVSARGSSAVVVKLKKPNAAWPNLLAFSSQIIEKAQAEKVSEKELGAPGHLLIGTGPWKFDRSTPGVSVQYSRNPYWTGTPQPANKVTISYFKSEAEMALALRSGAIDGASAYGSPRLFAVPGVHALPSAPEWTDFYAMNTASPPFNDVHVRRAVAYATDVSGIIKAFYPSGEVAEANSIVPATMFANFNADQVNTMLGSLPKYNFNLAAAKQELAKSAYPHGFTTELQVPVNEPLLLDAAQILSSDLAKIGITAKVKIVQLDEFGSLFGKKTKLLFLEFSSVFTDPQGIIQALLSPTEIEPPGSGTNWAEYRNAEVDELLAQQVEATNPTERLQMISKLLNIVAAEVPYRVILSHRTFATLSDKYVYPSFSLWTHSYTPWALGVKLAK